MAESRKLEEEMDMESASQTGNFHGYDSDGDDKPLVIDLGRSPTPDYISDVNGYEQMEEPSPCPTPGSPYVPSTDDPDDPAALDTSADIPDIPYEQEEPQQDDDDPEWDPTMEVGTSRRPDRTNTSTPEPVGLGRGCPPRPAYRSVRQILRRRLPDTTTVDHLQSNTDEEPEAGCRRNDRDGK